MICGGKNFVSSPPVFSNDAKRLLVCSGNSVSVFSASTALQISSLEGHRALVTSVVVESANSNALCFCWTSSIDGTIRYWDFSLPELMKTIDIQLPIFSMVIPSLISKPTELQDHNSDRFAYLSVYVDEQNKHPKARHGLTTKCNLTKSLLAKGVTLAETRKPANLTVSPTGKFFAIHSKRKLYIWMTPERDEKTPIAKKILLHHSKKFSCVAFHPTEKIIGAGDATGRILVWRGVGRKSFYSDSKLSKKMLSRIGEDDRPGVKGEDDADSCTTWHWHSTQVLTISFSSDGAYLYSAGGEGVLVVWQFETGKKNFLPRIGSPLLYFKASPDPSLCTISCSDNRILLLKMPSMEILRSLSGIKPPHLPSSLKSISKGLAFDQSSGTVAVCGENYVVQVYNLLDDRSVSEVQVCERNHQPGDEVRVGVTLVTFSYDGSAMSTVESRIPEEGIGGLVTLKFWELGSDKAKFSLSTVIYEPHRDAQISSISFRRNNLMAVSSSDGEDFKVWSRINEMDDKNPKWICYSVGSYRNKPIAAAVFSEDGSILAVAADTVITLWDPEKNSLIAVIGDTLNPIRSLTFIGDTDYIVSTSQGSKPELSVWSLSKLSLHWSYLLEVEAVASTSDGSLFAALALLPKSQRKSLSDTGLCQDGVILLLKSDDPNPVSTWAVSKAKGGAVAFLKGDRHKNELLAYICSDHEFLIFDPSTKDGHKHSSNSFENGFLHSNNPEEEKIEGYESIYGDLGVVEEKKKAYCIVADERKWETLFGTCSYNLPPLSKLCSSFLHSLTEKKC